MPAGSREILYLSADVVAELLDPAEVLQVAEETLRAAAADRAVWADPQRMDLRAEGLPAHFRTKQCWLPERNVVGTRVTGLNSDDRSPEGSPARVVILADPNTAQFLGIVDERWSYAVRTGAGVAVAMKYLAPAGTTRLGLIGAGLMGRGTLYAVREVLPLCEVLVTSRRAETREQFAREMRDELGLDVRPVATPQDVMEQADAVVLATTTSEPLVKAKWLRPGCTVYSMGMEQELETPAYFDVDKLVVDDWGAVSMKRDMRALREQHGFDRSRVHADFAELVTGARPGRERPDERILVRSEGLALMDVALSHHLYLKARERGMGQPIAV